MSQPANTHVFGEEALDVSRLTDVPWFFMRVTRYDVEPCIDLLSLDWFDRWRVAWARIGAYYFLRRVTWNLEYSQQSASSSGSSAVSLSGRVADEVRVAHDHPGCLRSGGG